MLFGAIERSLYFSLDKAEEDVLVGVIVWCNLLPFWKIDVHDHQFVIVDYLAKVFDFRSDHSAFI